jgi:phospholipid-transporting ATPase
MYDTYFLHPSLDTLVRNHFSSPDRCPMAAHLELRGGRCVSLEEDERGTSRVFWSWETWDPWVRWRKRRPNAVSNTKYTPLTFVPRNLFEQLRRLANAYFLLISAVALTPASPIQGGPFASALVIVLLVNAVREAFEDWQRRRADGHVNERAISVLRASSRGFFDVCCADLTRGDIVRIEEDEEFPADLVLLSSSHAGVGDCFVQTANLDGETNLKRKVALPQTSRLRSTGDVLSFDADLELAAPNADVHDFGGRLWVHSDAETEDSAATSVSSSTSSATPHALDFEQFLIGGTILKNTEWVMGIVAYTGPQTKDQLNSMQPPSKRSHVETVVNKMMLVMVGVVLCLCILSASLAATFEDPVRWYLPPPDRPELQFGSRFASFLVLYSAMVPICE